MTTTDPTSGASPQGQAARSYAGRAGDAVTFLFTGGNDPRRESRRITLGLIGLALVTVVLLNLGLYQRGQKQLVEGRWQQLARHTETARDQVRDVFQRFERQTRFLAESDEMNRWGWLLYSGSLDEVDRKHLEQELDRAARTFGFQHLALLGPDGVVLAQNDGGTPLSAEAHLELVVRATQSRGHLTADLHVESDGTRSFEVAAPLAWKGPEGSAPLLLSCAPVDGPLETLLYGEPGLGREIHPYLVRSEGERVQYLTSADPADPRRARISEATSERHARAAAMAANGVESSVEFKDVGGRSYCAITRFLPELGWGLVAQMDRDEMMAGMRGTAQRLLLMDLVLLAVAAAAAWLWRRQYRRGLAEREVQVTQRHAERVQAIFDTAFDAILTFDRKGRLCAINRAAENLFGRSAEEMDGRLIHRFLRWGKQAGDAEQRQSLPSPGVVIVAEALRADGEQIPVEFSLGQAGASDERLYTAIVRDIRERVEAEQRIRAIAEGLEVSNRRLEEVNAQLEEASRLKSEFLANTSHELRTPLNGMIGFLQLVLDGMCQNRDEEREFLKQALQCSRHLLGLINDVLDIAKIEAGKLTLDIRRVDIDTLFQEVHTVTHVQAAQKGLALRFELPGDNHYGIRCDFDKTKQILINLVGNAIKFTPKGSVTIKATPHPSLGHVLLEVIDTGIGVPKDQQKVIFEKFAQGDGSTTRKYGGTGLGLAISKSLVEVMGGVIGLESGGPGNGTRMYFSLPIWYEGASEIPVVDETTAVQIDGPSGGSLVLVVEDDPVFRKFVCAVLQQHGFRTAEVASAEAGWVLVRRLKPAVVVLDYALTCAEGAHLRTGWDLAVRMTTESTTRHIPLVFVTGFEMDLTEKLRATAFSRRPEHLMKPVEGPELIRRIEGLVGTPTGKQVRVLMADDDPSVAAYVRKVLPEDRYHLELATNGEQCLHVLRTQPRGFDLLLLDLMMPEVSGYDVLREMALTGAGATIPVVVLTNFPDPRTPDEKRLLEDGLVLDVVAKTAVHDNPAVLPHLIEWHLQATREGGQQEEAA